MEPQASKAGRGYVATVLGCYCPRCREGKLFENPFRFSFKSKNLKMNEVCSVCGQHTDLEVGFYYGTGYVSYMLSFALTVASFVAWWVLIGFSVKDTRFIYWLVFNSFLLVFAQPWLMRLSRSLWLSWFVKYDPYWKENGPSDAPERTNDALKNSW